MKHFSSKYTCGGASNGTGGLRRSKRLKAIASSSSSSTRPTVEGERDATEKSGNQEEDEMAVVLAVQPGGKGRLVRQMSVGENDVILKEIFSYFAIKELKSCRLVCHQWRDTTLDRWRRCGRLILVEIPLHRITSQMGATVAQFKLNSGYKRDPLRLSTKPFHHYNLHRISVCSPAISWFWTRIGPSIKTLSINLENLGDSGGLIKYILSEVPVMEKLSITFPTPALSSVWIPYLPFRHYERHHYRFQRPSPPPQRPHLNLKEVEITFGGSPDNRLELHWFWAEFCMKCPNVEKLKLAQVGTSWILTRMFEHIPTRSNQLGIDLGEEEPPEKILPLKDLDIMDLCPAALRCHHWYRPLVDCKFPLERLHLCLGQNDELVEPIYATQRLLESYSNTMKYLDLFRPPLYFPFREFPIQSEMPYLKTLKLTGSIARTFDFLRFMPELASLSVIRDVSGYDDQSQYQKKVLEILQTSYGPVTMRLNDRWVGSPQKLYEDQSLVGRLELVNLTRLETDFKFSPADFQVMTEWMPQMESFRAIVTNDIFKIICRNWPNLKELSALWDSSLDDETLTGIRWKQVTACKEIVITLKTGELSSFGVDGKPVELGIRAPNITSLQKLTYLRVQPRGKSKLDHLEMTDHVILFGFLRAPCLRTVIMQDGSAMPETVKALKLKVAHISMLTSTSPDEPTCSTMRRQKMQIQMEGDEMDYARVRVTKISRFVGNRVPTVGEVTEYNLPDPF